MKIGIYSGSFDPPTKGHIWIANEALAICDKLYLIVGPQPCKEALFPVSERLTMLKECCPKAIVDVLTERNILDFARSIYRQGDEILLFRGIRDNLDLEYELSIYHLLCLKLCLEPLNLHPVFLLSPPQLVNISSTEVKNLCARGDWTQAARYVSPPILPQLVKKFKGWVVAQPEVASMFETTTAGFGTRGITTTTVSCHRIEMQDAPDLPHLCDKTRHFFDLLVNEGLITLNETITGDQVRATLDPFPIDVVVSDTFHLMKIPINSVRPIGPRHITRSRSVGPIIVDVNLEVNCELLYEQKPSPIIIIEGKHRWIDAKERGERQIQAWVGERAMKRLKD